MPRVNAGPVLTKFHPKSEKRGKFHQYQRSGGSWSAQGLHEYCRIVRKLRTDFGKRGAPSTPYVRYLVKKVTEIGILIDKLNRKKLKTVRTPENIAAVAESLLETPSHQFTEYFADIICIKSLV